MQRYVQRAVQRPVERKLAIEVGDLVEYNGSALAFGDIIPMLPAITTGDNSYNRDGRSINAKQVKLTLTMRWQPNSFTPGASAAPIYATVWWVRDKQQKSFQAVSANGLGAYPYNYFDVLLGVLNVPAAPVGSWNERGLPIDTRRWVVKRKTVKLSPDSEELLSLYGAAAQRTHEDGAVMLKTVSFVQRFPKGGKRLTYRTDAQTYPDNYNSYCFITYQTPATPAGFGVTAAPQITASAVRVLQFTDL